MEGFKERLLALTPKQRLVAGGGLAATVAVLVLTFSLMTKTEEALLYAGLEPSAAGDVMAALDGQGVSYSVKGSSLYVEADERDRLRLLLAQQNLPSPKADGYELLDDLDGFSTTSEMFSVTYWRAKEGELARTLMTIPGVEMARVHIGVGERSLFSRREAKRTASVTLTAPAGLTDGQVRAVRYLTALAVPGLPAAEVGVVDTARGLLADKSDPLAEGNDEHVGALEASLLSLLEARVGPGNARVSVAVERVRQREEVESRTVDPERTALVSRRTSEASSSDVGADQPLTIASDLPDGEATETERRSQDQESSEDVSYAVSTVNRRVETMPGGVERLSIAVLVNDPLIEGQSAPRAEAELETLRSLIVAAAGVNEARGDLVTIRSLPFESPVLGTSAPETPRFALPPLGQIAGIGALLATIGLFLAFVVRPILMVSPAEARMAVFEGDFVTDRPVALLAGDPVSTLREQSQAKPEAAAALLNAWLQDEPEVSQS